MKSSTHGILQLVLGALTTLNVTNITGYISFLPPKWSGFLIVAITAAQAGLGWYNHFFTPAGNAIPPAA